MTLRMRVDARTKVPRHHLRAEADAEIRLLVAQGHTDPVDLPIHEFLVVVGALRPAKDHSAGMFIHRFRQWVTEAGAPDVERVAKSRQRLADAAWRRMFLMQDEKNRLLFRHGDSGARSRGGHLLAAIRPFANITGREAAMTLAPICDGFAGSRRL